MCATEQFFVVHAFVSFVATLFNNRYSFPFSKQHRISRSDIKYQKHFGQPKLNTLFNRNEPGARTRSRERVGGQRMAEQEEQRWGRGVGWGVLKQTIALEPEPERTSPHKINEYI